MWLYPTAIAKKKKKSQRNQPYPTAIAEKKL
jgi:hypothetical protein